MRESDNPAAGRRGADLLVEALVGSGVRHLFGVPGDTGVVLYDALWGRTDDITHVLARDERHAAAMADAYARATAGVGVVEVSSGGGTTYVIGGLGEAYASGVPLLVLTSDIHRGSRGTGALTEIDQAALFAAVTKDVLVADSVADLPRLVAGALETATAGRPGPVALVIAEDILDEHVDDLPMPFPTAALSTPGSCTPARVDDVAAAARVLARAERPVVLAGGGVHWSGAYAELAAVAERLGAGVATTIHGRGAVADGNDFTLGVAGNNSGGEPATGALAGADVVLVVGSRANATDTDSYTAPPRTAAVIAVDVDPAVVTRNYPDALALTGDAATVLAQLLEALPAPDADHVRVVDAHRRSIEAARTSARRSRPRPDPGAGRLLPDDVVDTVAEVAAEIAGDRAAVGVADPGAPTPAVATRWPVTSAGRRLLIPRGHGPMGYAIPAAIGVATALPDAVVASFTADGSFAMSCGELETVARLELPIVFVQFTNHSLGWIKMLQHLYADDRFFGVDPGPIDAVAVARACGLAAARPTTLDELRVEVKAAVAERRAVYLDVEVPHMIEVVPQVPAWHRALAGDRTRPVY